MLEPEPIGQEVRSEVDRFRGALELEEGFAFHVIVADTLDVLEAALAQLPERPAVVRPRPPSDASTEAAAIQILGALDTALDASRGRAVLLDAMIAHQEPAWAIVFRRLNELRNGLERRHRAPLLLAVSPQGETLLGREAPDLWSRRGSGMRLHDRRGSVLEAKLAPPPPPNDAAAFESLCFELFKEIWNDPGAQRYGRPGQQQFGVVIFGRTAGQWVGVQCKALRSGLSRAALESAIEDARAIELPLSTFILATTAPRDAKIHAFARELSEPGLEVQVWFWGDIWHELSERPELLKRIQPRYWPELKLPGKYLRRFPLTEAIEQMGAELEVAVELEDWGTAAIHASDFSERKLPQGDVAGAARYGELAIILADRTDDVSEQIIARVAAADALHQSGRREIALGRFREAEALQARIQPHYPRLYSLQGFQYCDLLLSEAERAAGSGQDARDPSREECREVEQRAAQTLEWAELNRLGQLDVALDHLTLGRARLYRAFLEGSTLHGAKAEIEKAIDGLRRASTLDHLPRGLLTRAWLRHSTGDTDGARADLDEAQEIAERGPMPLHLADINLYRARLFRDRAALAEARRLVDKHGYGRRLEELADLEAVAGTW